MKKVLNAFSRRSVVAGVVVVAMSATLSPLTGSFAAETTLTVTETDTEVQASATPDSEIKGVSWQVDGTEVFRDTVAPFEHMLLKADYSEEPHLLEAVVKLSSGTNESHSYEFTVGGSTPPPPPPHEEIMWDRLACDGTDVLDGVGLVRFVTFISGKGGRFRASYNGGPGSLRWYDSILHHSEGSSPTVVRVEAFKPTDDPAAADPVNLDGQEGEIRIADTVQDLEPGQTEFFFGSTKEGSTGQTCEFATNNIPAESEGHKSSRTAYDDPVESLRVNIRHYADGSPLPCDSVSDATGQKGRMVARLYATNDNADAVLDFHVHQETPGAIGPDQDGNPADTRFWEKGFNSIEMKAGEETEVAKVVMDYIHGRNTVHFMQQHSHDQVPIETFCSFES